MFSKLRKALIRFLADGDAIIMNVEVLPDGTIRRNAAGGMWIDNVLIRNWEKDYCVFIGPNGGERAIIAIDPEKTKNTIWVTNSRVNGRNPLTDKTW